MRLRSREKRLSWRGLSSYGTGRRPLTSHVKMRWILSSWFISALSVGALAPIAYSRCSRTIAQYNVMNAVLDSSQKDVRTIKSNRLAVFAASLQWTDAVKVVSRGTPRSRTSVTWEIFWSVSAVEKDGERGGRFPKVRHEHLLGLIGRSIFPAQAQVEEREERKRLDLDRGNTIFTSSAKREAEWLRAAGRSFMYNRKSNGPMTEPWGVSQ